MLENKLFEALLDIIPFAAYAVDVNTYEVVYANKLMSEKMYAPREEFCWKKVFGQEEVCSWCTIGQLKNRDKTYKSDKIIKTFFDEATDTWLQTYDELVRWPDGRTVKYSIAVDITEQKEIQASMIKTHTKLAIQSKRLKEANAKLEFMATKDFLTKTNNRGNFFVLGEDICKNNMDKSIFVAMFDIDKFKLLNDTYGHKAGDLALKAFVDEITKNLDTADVFGRLGGEEFGLIVLSEHKEDVLEKVENIRKSIEKIVVNYENSEIKFTVSIGLIQMDSNQTVDMALEQADKELYTAKDSGRNRLVFRQRKA